MCINPGFLKPIHSPWIKVLITLTLVGVLLDRLDLGKISETLSGFDRSMGLLMFAVNILLILLFAKRWQRIASSLEFEAPYRQLVRAIWLATFLGQFGPTLIIAEATRFRVLRNYASTTQLVTSQILDRVSGQVVLFLIVLLLSPFYSVELKPSLPKLLLIVTGFTLLTALFIRFRYRSLRWVLQGSTGRAIKLLSIQHGLLSHYWISLIIQLLLVLNFTFAAKGLGVVDQWLPFMLLVPLVFAAITLLPITISDWGSRETAAILFLTPAGLDAESIVSVSVLYGLFHLCAALPGGLYLLRRLPNKT